MSLRVLKFRPRDRSKKQKEHSGVLPIPSAIPWKHPTDAIYCFEIINSALKQDNKDEVTKNLLTWFIVNSDQETLAKFIKWIVKDN